jgi:hypothetical protein
MPLNFFDFGIYTEWRANGRCCKRGAFILGY